MNEEELKRSREVIHIRTSLETLFASQLGARFEPGLLRIYKFIKLPSDSASNAHVA